LIINILYLLDRLILTKILFLMNLKVKKYQIFQKLN